MTITPEQLRTRFAPTFDELLDADLQLVIDEAERDHNPSYFGGKADDALLFKVAHAVVQGSSDSAAPGPTTSVSADGFSASFAVMAAGSASADELRATSYGRRYLAYVQGLVGVRTSVTTT